MEPKKHCDCKQQAIMVTSWTDNSPGRRYFTCAIKKGDKGKGCDYFEWYDPIICRRSTALIPGLLRSIGSKNATIERLRARERKLLLAIFVLVLLLVIVMLV